MTLTAVLFVGGESRRMGVDKATLSCGGELLWSRQLRILRELKPETILVSAKARPDWCPPGIETVVDEFPSRGPVSGLAATLKWARTSHLLALAIDLPRVERAHLQCLWLRAKEGVGVLPSLNGTLQPLCAIYPVNPEVRETSTFALQGQDFSLRTFASELTRRNLLEVLHVAPVDAANYINVNTPLEWVQAITF